MRKIVSVCLSIVLAVSLFGQKRIVFIGDSITDGKWGYECDGSRNPDDMNHIFGHGYMFLCASQYMAEYPDLQYDFYNRGISGNALNDVAKQWSANALSLNPDVLSVLVGINDILNNNLVVDTIAFEKQYRELLSRSRAKNPNVRIVLGEPFCEVGFRLDTAGIARKQCEALSHAVERIAKDYNAVFVPYQAMFDELCKTGDVTYWIWDGVHPTPAGHYKMAQLWMKSVGEL